MSYSSPMRNKPGMKVPTRSSLIYLIAFTISAVVIFGSAATSQKLSGVPSVKSQEKLPGQEKLPAKAKLPDKEFTRAPEKPHDPTAFFFKFDQLDYYYRVPGEFTHSLNR